MTERRVEAPVEKKRIGIEDLLRWAYREELPKAHTRSHLLPREHGQAWGQVREFGELLAVIDDFENVWGLAPDWTALGGPDPDAEAVGLAVEGLDHLTSDLLDCGGLLSDVERPDTLGLVRAAERRAGELVTVRMPNGAVLLRSTPRFLVVRHALGAPVPDLTVDVPELKVESANGKPKWFRRITINAADGSSYEQEVDGYDRSRKRPMPGAYRRYYLDPDPTDVAVARAEYSVWRATLDVLAEELAQPGRLARFAVQPSERPYAPWVDGMPAGPRVLPSMLPVYKTVFGDVTPEEYYRKRPLPPLTRGRSLT